MVEPRIKKLRLEIDAVNKQLLELLNQRASLVDEIRKIKEMYAIERFDPKREREVHAEQMRKLRGIVAERHPSLPTELLLMALDGSVETIS